MLEVLKSINNLKLKVYLRLQKTESLIWEDTFENLRKKNRKRKYEQNNYKKDKVFLEKKQQQR